MTTPTFCTGELEAPSKVPWGKILLSSSTTENLLHQLHKVGQVDGLKSVPRMDSNWFSIREKSQGLRGVKGEEEEVVAEEPSCSMVNERLEAITTQPQRTTVKKQKMSNEEKSSFSNYYRIKQ